MNFPKKPMRYTDYSKLSWYFKLNEVPCDMMQSVSPKGRKDRIELSKSIILIQMMNLII